MVWMYTDLALASALVTTHLPTGTRMFSCSWLLPARALRLGDGQVTVLRQRDGQNQTVTVKVVASAGGKALISATDGRQLAPGDRVALDPSLSESTGDKP